MVEKVSPYEPTRNDRIITWLIFFLSLGYFSIYLDAGINWMDEGYLIASAERILAGQAPYRDSYGFYAPGRWYLFALAFKVFGHQFLITRVVWAIGHAALGALMYRTCRRALPVTWSLLPTLAITLAPGPWYKFPFMMGTAVGIWLAISYAEKPTVRRAVYMGLGTAAIFFFRQDVGVLSGVLGTLFVILYAPVKRKIHLCTLLAASLGPTALWMGYFFAVGGGVEMMQQIALAGAKGFAANPVPYPRLLDPLDKTGAPNTALACMGRLAFYLPFIIVPAFLFFAVKHRKLRDTTHNALWLGVAVFALIAFNHIRARSDFPHLWQAYVVFDIMAALILAGTAKRIPKISAIIGAAILLVIGGGAFSSNHIHHGTIRVLQGRTVRYENPRAPVRVTPAEKELMSYVEGKIDEYVPPGGYFFLAPDIPIFYFLADRKNPTAWDVVRPSFLWGDEDEKKAAEMIQSADTPLVIIHQLESLPPNRKKFSDVYKILYNYLAEHYLLIDRKGNFRFYIRKRPEKAGAESGG